MVEISSVSDNPFIEIQFLDNARACRILKLHKLVI